MTYEEACELLEKLRSKANLLSQGLADCNRDLRGLERGLEHRKVFREAISRLVAAVEATGILDDDTGPRDVLREIHRRELCQAVAHAWNVLSSTKNPSAT